MKLKPVRVRIWACTIFVAALFSGILPQRAAAQYSDPPERVARLNYMQGSVSFQPGGEADWVSAIVNRPVTTGDRLWADQGSRAEMHLGSSTIRLGTQTGMSFLNLDDRTTQIELSEGALNIRVLRLDRDEIFEVDTPNQAFSINRPGQYRIEASEDGYSTMVTVRAGEGEVTGGGRTYSVGAGLTGNFTGTDTLRSAIYKAGGYDDFDTWSQARDRHDDGAASARYVSPDLVGYQDLDDYGAWRSDPNYGNVWMPRVSAGWAPYHDGHWVWISPWGWTWIDDAPWGYAPFHYGRWVNVSNNWGWIPGPVAVRPVYAPALVVFIGGPRFSLSVAVGGGGNVGWFPLGPREVYVPAYQTSRAYVDRVNISNTTVNNVTITNVYNNSNNTNIQYSNRNVRGGVTAVTRNTFTNAQPVGRGAIAVNAQEIASAPINRRAEVAPTRNSVFGSSPAAGTRVPQPPAAVINRAVVAKTPPPPAPVQFARQQTRLAAQPGKPLQKNEVEALRAPNAPAAQSRVKQAPPGRQSAADSNQPMNPGANVRPSVPTPVPAAVNPPVSNAPAERGGNRGRPPAAAQSAPAVPATPGPTVVTPPVSNAQADRGGNRGRPPTATQRAPAAAATPGPETANPASNNAPADRGGNRGRPPVAAQPAPAVTTTPGPAIVTPPVSNAPANRGGNRGRPPAATQPAPATPATPGPAATTPPVSNAPADRGGNRGRPPADARPAPAAPGPETANPPSNNAPANRGGNRGQPRNSPAPEQVPVTKVPSPASSNDPAERNGNRGQ